MTAALGKTEIKTTACASSVWVTTAFASESSYRDVIEGDCSEHNRNIFARPAIMAAGYASPEYQISASAIRGCVKAASGSPE